MFFFARNFFSRISFESKIMGEKILIKFTDLLSSIGIFIQMCKPMVASHIPQFLEWNIPHKSKILFPFWSFVYSERYRKKKEKN